MKKLVELCGFRTLKSRTVRVKTESWAVSGGVFKCARREASGKALSIVSVTWPWHYGMCQLSIVGDDRDLWMVTLLLRISFVLMHFTLFHHFVFPFIIYQSDFVSNLFIPCIRQMPLVVIFAIPLRKSNLQTKLICMLFPNHYEWQHSLATESTRHHYF